MASIGIVSALTGPWRTWRGGMLDRLIQTDVTLYPGFSGGPLVDAAGKVAGINSSILARGMSVAIPAETVRGVVQALLTQGRVRRGYLGVSSQPVPVPPSLAQSFSLAQAIGLLVVGVEPGGPADKGGLMLGDLIIALAGQPVQDAEDLQRLLGPERVGVATPIRIIRGGQLMEVIVTVGERP
jgi:S1-C subfamily serine protease